MGLEDGNGSHKQSNLNVEDTERNRVDNYNPTEKNTKQDNGVVGYGSENGENLKKNEDNFTAKEKLGKDGRKEDDDADNSQSSSFSSSLSLKVPSSDDDYPLSSPSSSSTFSLRKDLLQKHNIQQGFNKRKNNNNVAFAAVEDLEDKVSKSKSSISVESETGSLESVTFPVSDLRAVVKSPPPLQLMDKAGYDLRRIPSNVFEASASMARVDWSAASNESLFSLQIGTSFARDRIPLGENKHGISSRISIAETANRPLVNTEGSGEKPLSEKKKKNKSIKIDKVNEVADENAITKANEEEEEDQKEDIANNKEDKKQKDERTLVKWKSTTVPIKPDATGISEDSADSLVKKENCTCSSFYCSNCSRAYCSNCNCTSCFCSNCCWASCYCWNCTRKRWVLCGCCQRPKAVSDGVKVSPKVVSSEQPPLSTSRSWWNCFSCHFCSCSSCKSCSRSFCCPWSYYSYDVSSCCSCKPCSCLSCRSCCCSSCCPCSCSSCLPSKCCCWSCNPCSFSCSSCCPFSSISCRLCCCPQCPHCSCSRRLCRCSCDYK